MSATLPPGGARTGAERGRFMTRRLRSLRSPFGVSGERRHGMGRVFVLNAIGGALVVATFLAICSWSYLAAEDELIETAEFTAEKWVRAALADTDVLAHILTGEALPAADRAYLEAITHTAGLLGFAVYGSLGQQLFAHSAASPVPLPDAALADATTVRRADILRDTADGRAQIIARISLPLASISRNNGSIVVMIDQSDAIGLYEGEMLGTMMLTGLLASIALANCIVVAVLLKRKQRSDEQILVLAHKDSLTGLANRNLFQDVLDRHFPVDLAARSSIALHFVDLDGFKAVNDTLGHPAGDKLLQRVAQRLLALVDENGLVARLGGDEFAVLQSNVTSPHEAEVFGAQLVESVRTLRKVDGNAVKVSLSVGTALAPGHAVTAEDLAKFADIALYRAKEAGRDRQVTFAASMGDEVQARNYMRMVVLQAIESGAFEMNYQPICSAEDGRITAFEALARLPARLGRRSIAPADFIPVAEAMGLMPRLGAWVLHEACRTAATWPVPVAVSVNLSAQQFSEDIVGTVSQALAGSGLPPERLHLEITESLLIANEGIVTRQLTALKSLGVGIALDDFGTGYSSLNYLWKFPFDKLKVDRSLFDSIELSTGVCEVLRTITAMGAAMHLTVVAEGIETEEQRRFARRAGYDELQGYLCGAPVAAEAVPPLLLRRPHGGPPPLLLAAG
ncbi:bifunctional diguanylate cyclase/phosphodiesterase [Acuticoccus sp. I52.16.1]|uniref:putative bifunctional diguanylate cyclase/phosphodiesterase n=1 Tax=Acuticoccus sp. I52.16.1 TaxID=2928472 RepID=UPI001FD3553D|nr:EAL domain-containing protein [Acuticoccus sp. I52.16.1]UOM35199.1 EAL domain-containing protein [Acuticoccus sp. I52.16.1]